MPGQFADAPHKDAVERIVHHWTKGEKVRYVLRWYGYIMVFDTIELPEQIPEHFIIRFWPGIEEAEAVPQRR